MRLPRTGPAASATDEKALSSQGGEGKVQRENMPRPHLNNGGRLFVTSLRRSTTLGRGIRRKALLRVLSSGYTDQVKLMAAKLQSGGNEGTLMKMAA
jgi:hypothetical protein